MLCSQDSTKFLELGAPHRVRHLFVQAGWPGPRGKTSRFIFRSCFLDTGQDDPEQGSAAWRALSGADTRKTRAEKAGVICFLPKPFTGEKLIDCLNQALIG